MHDEKLKTHTDPRHLFRKRFPKDALLRTGALTPVWSWGLAGSNGSPGKERAPDSGYWCSTALRGAQATLTLTTSARPSAWAVGHPTGEEGTQPRRHGRGEQ